MSAYDGSMKYDGGGNKLKPPENVPPVLRKLKHSSILTSPQIDRILDHLESVHPEGISQLETMCGINNGIIMSIIPSEDYPHIIITSAMAIMMNQFSLRIVMNNEYIVRSIKDSILRAIQTKPVPPQTPMVKEISNEEKQEPKS